jgi:predicted Zn-dependent peptidase
LAFEGRVTESSPIHPRVHRFEVEGLVVLFERMDSPLVAYCLSIGAGSRFDGETPGLAHFSEHMLFQGTENFDQLALNRRAAEVGGSHNAFTGYDSMALNFESFPEDMAGALELLFEQFYRTRPEAVRFRKEKRIVLDELRGVREDPFESLAERAWREFYADPVGNPIAGTASSVRALRIEDVERFYARRFVNANAVLAVVGDLDPARLRRQVRALVDSRRVGRRQKGRPVRRGAGKSLALRSRQAGQSHVHRLHAIDFRPRAFLAVEIALDLVGADPDSLLFQAVREDYGLGYDISADAEWGRGFAAAMVSASAGPREGRRLAKVIEEVLVTSVADGFSEADLERARHKRRYSHALLGERRLDRAVARAESEITGFPSLEEARWILDDLSHAEIQRAWKRAVEGRCLVSVRESGR